MRRDNRAEVVKLYETKVRLANENLERAKAAVAAAERRLTHANETLAHVKTKYETGV